MGIIFRNNRPYGGEPLPDISTYATMEDFESDVPAPEKNHIYIIAGNLYFWNETDQEIKKTPNLNGTENTIPIFDNNDGLKDSIFSYATANSRKILAAALQSGDTLTISGSDGTNTASLSLKDSALINASGSTNVGLFGKSSIYMQGSTSGQGARIAMPSGNPSITMMGDSQISMPSGTPSITMMDRASISMMGAAVQNGRPQLTMQGNSTMSMIGNSNGSPNFAMQDGSSVQIQNSSQAEIKGMTHINIGNTNTSTTHTTDGSNVVRITVNDNAKVDINNQTQVYLHGGGIVIGGQGSKHNLTLLYCVPYNNYSSMPSVSTIRSASDLVYFADEYGIPSIREIDSVSDITNAGFSLKTSASSVTTMWRNRTRYYYFSEVYEASWTVSRGYPVTFDGNGLALLNDSSFLDMSGSSSIHGHDNAWFDVSGYSHTSFGEYANVSIGGRSHFQMGGFTDHKKTDDSDNYEYEAPILQMAGNSVLCMNSSYQNSPSIMANGASGLILNGLNNDDAPQTVYGPTLITQPTGLVFSTLFGYPRLGKNSTLDSGNMGSVYGIGVNNPIYSPLSPDSEIPNFKMKELDELISNNNTYKLSKDNYNQAMDIWNSYARYYNSVVSGSSAKIDKEFSDFVTSEDSDFYYINKSQWQHFMQNVNQSKFTHFCVSQNTIALLENHKEGRSYIKIGAGADQYTKIFIQDNTHTEMRQNSIFSLRGAAQQKYYWNSTTEKYEYYFRPWADFPYTQPTDGSMLTLYDDSVLVMHGTWDTSDFVATDGTVITPPAGWQEHPEKHINSPLVEIIDNAEIRLYGNISVKANTENNITTITFGGTTQEGEVSFTIEELKSLKNLVGSIPTRVITDPEQATENGLLYFIDEEGE